MEATIMAYIGLRVQIQVTCKRIWKQPHYSGFGPTRLRIRDDT